MYLHVQNIFRITFAFSSRENRKYYFSIKNKEVDTNYLTMTVLSIKDNICMVQVNDSFTAATKTYCEGDLKFVQQVEVLIQ